jgi:L-gulonate 3-dehydrogenase
MSSSNEHNQIGIVGAGLIGRAWAVVFARAGFKVRLHDMSTQALHDCESAILASLTDLAAYGLLKETPAQVMRKIGLASTLQEAVGNASLVQENVRETLETKVALFAELDLLVPAGVPIASSTSWIPSSRFTEGLVHRDRCLVGHPINPPHVVPLVEVCPAPWTSKEAVERALEIYRAAGQSPVLLRKEIDGFLVNRVQGAVLNEMMSLHEQGYASVADLDAVMRDGLGMRWAFMGPFETIDLNAPAGLLDYADRFGQTYKRVALESKPFDWNAVAVAEIEHERRQQMPLSEIQNRSAWRDRCLMQLAAQKKKFVADSEG